MIGGSDMEIYERLFITMDEKGIMQKEIFENIEGTSKSTVSSWKTRRIDPPSKLIIPLCQLLNVSVEYMLTGENSDKSSQLFPKNHISDSDQQLLEMFHQLPSELQHEIRGEIRGMLKKAAANAKSEAV